MLVTADALYCQVEHARYLVPWAGVNTGATQLLRGRGRIEERVIRVLAVAAVILFPHAAQAAQITRRGRRVTARDGPLETVYVVRSLPAAQAEPAQIACWLIGDWAKRVLRRSSIRPISCRLRRATASWPCSGTRRVRGADRTGCAGRSPTATAARETHGRCARHVHTTECTGSFTPPLSGFRTARERCAFPPVVPAVRPLPATSRRR